MKISDAIESAQSFLLSQVSDVSPGWGTEPFTQLDPWTTAQICGNLSLSSDSNFYALRRAIAWLDVKQNLDGSWGSISHKEQPETPATANCAIAYLRHFGPKSYTALKALDWLFQNYDGGWTTLPTESNPRFSICHHYSTAYALRAFSRGPKKTGYSLCIQEGLMSLIDSKHPNAGWGFHSKSPADPTFTCYVSHALLDIARNARIKVPKTVISEALEWLFTQQDEEGAWYDWHGVEQSPEATAYSIYIILSAGLSFGIEQIENALAWLIKIQNDDGSWSMNPRDDDGRGNNWVTHTVIMGLYAWQKYESTFAKKIIEGPRDTWLSPIDLDPSEYIKSNNLIIKEAAISDEQLRSYSEQENLKLLYENKIAVSWGDFPLCRPNEHTMSNAIDTYVNQKLPYEEIRKTLENQGKIEVHGIHPEHFSSFYSFLGYESCGALNFSHKKFRSLYNSQRPKFFECVRKDKSKVLVLAVIPGRDYLLHYASLVRHLVYSLTQSKNLDEMVRVFRYPTAESSISQWTELSSNLVHENDTVIIGHIPELVAHFNKNYEAIMTMDTNYFGAHRYSIGPQCTVTLLGVKYCFWGSISAEITFQLCNLNISEIIYVSKLGTLMSPQDIYSKIFCPSQFFILNYDAITHEFSPPPNRILEKYPTLDSGCHVSIPTVLEEDYIQRHLADFLGANSIENEISQIAKSISLFNEVNQTSISFTGLHFATDYLRKRSERELETDHDLSKMASAQGREKKHLIIKKIFDEYLEPYLKSKQNDYS